MSRLPSHGLHQGHQRRILTTFQYVDGLLHDAVSALSGAGSRSPLSLLAADGRPGQDRLLESSADDVRALMLRTLERLGISCEVPRVPATRKALTNLVAAEIAIEELSPRTLSGYGPLQGETAALLEACCAEITALLVQASTALADPETRS